MSKITFLVSPGKRLLLLLFTFVIGAIVSAVGAGVLVAMGGQERYVAMLRISTVVQDIFMLIVPAVVTAMLVTRQPVELLCLGRAPRYQMVVAAVLVMIFSSPFMSWIIELNASMHLPESLAGFEAKIRAMEDNATAAVEMVLGPHTVGNLVVSLLIVGVMAGVAEELFFRGALQRLLASARMSPHVAVWIAAAVFSAVHFQFFGFVPRMLLGAFFGYLMLWSGSVWLPMIAHAVNNSLYVVLRYTTGSGEPSISGADSAASIIISALLTIAGLWVIYMSSRRPEQ